MAFESISLACALFTIHCMCARCKVQFFSFHFVGWLWLADVSVCSSFPNGGGRMRQNSHGIRNKTIASGNLGILLKLCVLEWMQNIYKYMEIHTHKCTHARITLDTMRGETISREGQGKKAATKYVTNNQYSDFSVCWAQNMCRYVLRRIRTISKSKVMSVLPCME